MNQKFLTVTSQYLTIAAILGSSLVFSPVVQAACPDSIIQCWCDNGQMICTHQLPSCTQVTETHNEMPGAASCQTASPTATASGIQVGVGGGPVATSSPQVIAALGNNSAGELPKTGPEASLVLVGLIPLGYKLKSFRSKVTDSASTIWARRQLGH